MPGNSEAVWPSPPMPSTTMSAACRASRFAACTASSSVSPACANGSEMRGGGAFAQQVLAQQAGVGMRVVRRQPAFVDQADVHARPVEVGVRESARTPAPGWCRRTAAGARGPCARAHRRARSRCRPRQPAAQRPTSSLSCQSTRAVPVFTLACRRPRRPRSPRSRAGPVADAPPPASAPAPSPGEAPLCSNRWRKPERCSVGSSFGTSPPERNTPSHAPSVSTRSPAMAPNTAQNTSTARIESGSPCARARGHVARFHRPGIDAGDAAERAMQVHQAHAGDQAFDRHAAVFCASCCRIAISSGVPGAKSTCPPSVASGRAAVADQQAADAKASARADDGEGARVAAFAALAAPLHRPERGDVVGLQREHRHRLRGEVVDQRMRCRPSASQLRRIEITHGKLVMRASSPSTRPATAATMACTLAPVASR